MLTRIALRICVQQALLGKTTAGNNVLDSQFAALDLGDDGALRTDQDKPFVSVFTDGAQLERVEGLGLFAGALTDLVIEAGISSAAMEQDPETGERYVVAGIPDTDAGLELALDLMMRQVSDALAAPGVVWADLVRDLIDVKQITRSRIGSKSGGVRTAGHELRISCRLPDEPVVGATVEGTVFGRFLDAVAASENAGLVRAGVLMRQAIGLEGSEYQAAQRTWGLSDMEAIAMALRPLAITDAGDVPELNSVTVERG